MKLRDCVLDVDWTVRSPLEIKRPKADWVLARSEGTIPNSMYELYTKANFLSYGSSVGLLGDDDNILFGYFSMPLRSLKELCVEANEEVQAFESAMGERFDFGKKLRGQSWDRTADQRARRPLKRLTIALAGILDALADLIALFFTKLIPKLRLGRAQFVDVETWLKGSAPTPAMIVSPHDYYLERLYLSLKPVVVTSGSDREWLPLLRLLRNKSAHMGDRMFPFFGFHDKQGTFYEFLPRQWPHILESRITRNDPSAKKPKLKHPGFEELLMHEDVISFAKGLRNKVSRVIEGVCEVLKTAYPQFQNLPLNEEALKQLTQSSESFDFEFFSEPLRVGGD